MNDRERLILATSVARSLEKLYEDLDQNLTSVSSEDIALALSDWDIEDEWWKWSEG